MKKFFLKLAARGARPMINCFKAAGLPVTLALIFVAQNAAFISWLKIAPQIYLQLLTASFALGLLCYGPAIFLRTRLRFVYLSVVSLLLSLLLIAEYLYYSYAGGFLQIAALKLTGESSVVIGTALSFVTPRLALFLCNFFLVVLAGLFVRYHKVLPVILSFWEKIVVGLLILASVFGGYHVLFAAEKRDWGDSSRLYKRLYDLNNVVGKMGVVNFFLEDALKRALTGGRITDEDKAFVKDWNAHRSDATEHGATFGVAKNRNLIFIQVESLESAVMNTRIAEKEITPNLNQLAREGLFFSNYYAQVGLGNTADAEFMTLTSLYPLLDSVAFVDRAQNQYAALPQLLVDHGYHTHVFHGDVATFWNRANIYPHLGYQTWHMKDTFHITRDIGITGLGDEDFFTQAFPKIQTLQQPFMATLITLSSHTPFLLPDDLRDMPVPTDSGLNETQTHYLESIHYTDRVIGDFIAQLKQTSLYNNSVIVIFGDHGSYTGIDQALNKRAVVGDQNNAQVPLIILAPGTELLGEQTQPASHLDLYPTIANLLGIVPPRSVLGQDALQSTSTVAVLRKNGTGGISAIVGTKLSYIAANDGVFENGRCLANQQPRPIEDCRALYTKESAVIKVSDIITRGNLLELLR